ncbi:group II intron reverse transcriptase/maturase [Streptomyces sp. NPDC091287]|uniref:group II intron reverse transcriptase/maturase n=1 Tax=Streptomyces sp. NPDC091287 TaxID=3365988 RepID=UPI0037FFCAD9
MKQTTTKILEPMGKLDVSGVPETNGPEGEVFDWQSIDWNSVEGDVRRLRQRIFTAARKGDLKKVRNLQKLMLRSRSNALVAVRRVSEINAGRKTPGVDGYTAMRESSKVMLAEWTQSRLRTWKPMAVKRVYIPKSNGKQRPLGIPVVRDRAMQALVLNALEPEWEARFEPRSYGFRPGRGCHDAIEAIFCVTRGRLSKRRWVLDADLAAAFDRIDHQRLVASLGTFPARALVQAWLKSGVIENGRFAPTEEGTPQGGVISPLLLNIALHGMEEAAGVRYRTDGVHTGKTAPDSPVLIRYADDFVALCHSYDQAQRVKVQLADWLTPRGLAFNEEKTRIVHLEEGFDFLGYNVRLYKGSKLLIKPSPAAVARFRNRLRTELRMLRGTNSLEVISKLNPILRGWAAYYRNGVSKRVFSDIDDYLWWAVFRWATRRHPNKSKRWVSDRYFGAFNSANQARWIFGDRATGQYLTKLAWTPIVRHVMVSGSASPDDPELAEYWAQRRKKYKPPLSDARVRMMRRQHGKCPLCGEYLLYADTEPQHPDDWAKWLTGIRKAIRLQAVTLLSETNGASDRKVPREQFIHAHCGKRLEQKPQSHLRASPFLKPVGLA